LKGGSLDWWIGGLMDWWIDGVLEVLHQSHNNPQIHQSNNPTRKDGAKS
jgi:hypothetical protein